MKKFLQDFKKFISRGNIVELAVAVMVGQAFTRIVQSIVNDIVMPLISLATGQTGFANYKYVIRPGDPSLGIAENAIYYGRFIQSLFDFIFIALVVFLFFKLFKRIDLMLTKAGFEKEVKAPKETTEAILKDIRGLLNKSLKEK